MLNFSSSLQVRDNLSLGFFAQNLLNNRGFTDAFSIENAAARARPRTYGVNFHVNID
jgi:outer membrane receptor protein involved in Fe transport